MRLDFRKIALAATVSLGCAAEANGQVVINKNICYERLTGTTYIFDMATAGNIARAVKANDGKMPAEWVKFLQRTPYCETGDFAEIDAGRFFLKLPETDRAGWSPVGPSAAPSS